LLVDGVKSAIEDEAAQAKLATTLQNVTGATDAQIAATESWITQQGLSLGITDDELRPALERLTRATGDVEKAQSLASLAFDISAGTGKSLETVSNALGKAVEGNVGGLAKLGIGLDAADLKTMSLDEVTKLLGETFGGQATEKAETFAGKMDRLKLAFDEGKETVGGFVLDAITPLLTIFTDKIVPIITTLSTDIGEKLSPVFTTLGTFFKDTFIPGLTALWDYLNKYIIPIFKAQLTPAIQGVKNIFGAIGDLIESNTGFFKLLGVGITAFLVLAKPVASFIGGTFKVAFSGIALLIDGISLAMKGLVAAVNLVVSGLNLLISGYNIVNNLTGGKDLPKIPKLAAGGAVQPNRPYIVGEQGQELFVPSSSGRIIPNNKLGGGGGGNIFINVSGAIDQEGTARRIVDVLNNSFYRGTNGANALAF
jgi:phage-related protein